MLLHALEGVGGEGLGFDLFLDLIRRLLLAEAVADVAGVAERAGEVAFQDVGVQVVDAAAAAGIDEVFEVVVRAFPFLDDLAVFVIGGGAGVVRHGDVAAFALDDDADACALELVHVLAVLVLGQTAHFKDERGLLVALIDDLGVGGFAVVLVAEAAADAPHAGGEFHLAEEPAGDVHLVDALVAEVAVAVVPGPMPVVVQLFACQLRLRRRATPEVVVDRVGDGLRAFGFANAGAALVAEST